MDLFKNSLFMIEISDRDRIYNLQNNNNKICYKVDKVQGKNYMSIRPTAYFIVLCSTAE